MAKKNKSRRARKQAEEKLQKMKTPHLIQKGEALLSSGSFRESVKVLKIALQKQPTDQSILSLLARAYTGREQQLRLKGMVREADALHRQYEQYRPDPAQLSAVDLVHFMEATDTGHAVSLYNGFLSANPPDIAAETVLTKKLLSDSDWDTVDQLAESALLKPELPIFREAIRLMDAADWETALECLRPVTRRSPLAPVKLLCRAMVCFYQGDDAGMRRALDMLPETFARHPLVECLRSDPRQIEPLWQGRFVSPDQITSLLRTLEKAAYIGEVVKEIRKLAAAIRPRDVESASEALLMALWPLVCKGEIDAYDLSELAQRLLPHPHYEAIDRKLLFLGFENIVEDTGDYLGVLNTEFPDPANRQLAASMVLSESVERMVKEGRQTELGDWFSDKSLNRLGIYSNQPECMLLEMTIKALELDPRNSQAGDLLTQLPQSSRKARQLAETGLLKIVDHRPDDPRPCLALAKLNFEKNAYRKAQTYLKQAEQRAPHDDQVKDQMTLALIRSIDANLKRGKYHLVKADLERAAARCGKKTMAQVTARRILFEMTQTEQLSLFGDNISGTDKGRGRAILERHLDALPDAEALQTLGLLVAGSQQHPGIWSKADKLELEKVFKSRLAAANQLPSKTLRGVLLPDATAFPLPVRRLAWLNAFIRHYKKLLSLLNDEDLLPVLDLWLEEGQREQCLEEIRQRLKTASEPFKSLFLFYRLVVMDIDGRQRADAEAFEEIIDRMGPKHLELFRAASQRLSKLAWGPLKSALSRFSFEMLDKAADDWDEDWDDDDDFDELEMDPFDTFDPGMAGGPPMEALIFMVEKVVDLHRLRGAKGETLKRKRQAIMKDYQARDAIEGLAEILSPSMAAKLSPEARYLVLGKEDK